MKRIRGIAVVSALLLCVVIGYAQDAKTLLDSYARNFDAGDTRTKLQLIQDAAGRKDSTLAPLFEKAIDFAVNKSERGKDESRIRQISLIAVEQCERYGYAEARAVIVKLFFTDADSQVRVKSLKALGTLAKGDQTIVRSLNEWLAGEVSASKAGKLPVLQVILRCVVTLGELNDASSFPVVFSVLNAGYSQEISSAALKALVNLKGDFKALLSEIVRNGTIREKREALMVALESVNMNDTEKGEIAEISLDVALRTGSVELQELKDLRDIRARANRALSARKWSKATKFILQYFETALVEYEKGIINKPDLLEIIRSLGNMGTYEAAERLALYLDLLNKYTEKTKVYDEQIVLETIGSLSRLGDKIAFDYLMNVRFLTYSARVKTKADDAIKNLKW